VGVGRGERGIESLNLDGLIRIVVWYGVDMVCICILLSG
jgi:hypothetical protein